MSDEVTEKWRKPPEILEVKDDTSHVDGATGHLRYDFKATLAPEDVERIRTGYLCLRCLEPQSEPFPEECQAWWCTYKIRTCQAEDFSKAYEGKTRVGPSTDISYELDLLDDTHERRIYIPGTQILVPSSVQIKGKRVRATGKIHTLGES